MQDRDAVREGAVALGLGVTVTEAVAVGAEAERVSVRVPLRVSVSERVRDGQLVAERVRVTERVSGSVSGGVAVGEGVGLGPVGVGVREGGVGVREAVGVRRPEALEEGVEVRLREAVEGERDFDRETMGLSVGVRVGGEAVGVRLRVRECPVGVALEGVGLKDGEAEKLLVHELLGVPVKLRVKLPVNTCDELTVRDNVGLGVAVQVPDTLRVRERLPEAVPVTVRLTTLDIESVVELESETDMDRSGDADGVCDVVPVPVDAVRLRKLAVGEVLSEWPRERLAVSVPDCGLGVQLCVCVREREGVALPDAALTAVADAVLDAELDGLHEGGVGVAVGDGGERVRVGDSVTLHELQTVAEGVREDVVLGVGLADAVSRRLRVALAEAVRVFGTDPDTERLGLGLSVTVFVAELLGVGGLADRLCVGTGT